jgi:hypothetical protein
MTSYKAVTGRARDALDALAAMRLDQERHAERAVAAAAAVRREAEAEAARLDLAVSDARAALAAARRDGGGDERAGEAQARLRFWSRLERQIAVATDALASHRAGTLARALAADEAARAAHRKTHQRREVVDKAIARRRAARERERERRAEAAVDDLPRRRSP